MQRNCGYKTSVFLYYSVFYLCLLVIFQAFPRFYLCSRYLLMFENLLRTVDCRLTVPYWNWARHYSYAWSVTPNYHMWDKEGGFGGNGDPEKGYCVTDGPFGLDKYKVIVNLTSKNDRTYIAEKNCEKYIHEGVRCPSRQTIYENPKWRSQYAKCYYAYLDMQYTSCLRRSFQWYPPSLKCVKNLIEMMSSKNWDDFGILIMGHLHDRVHFNVGEFD